MSETRSTPFTVERLRALEAHEIARQVAEQGDVVEPLGGDPQVLGTVHRLRVVAAVQPLGELVFEGATRLSVAGGEGGLVMIASADDRRGDVEGGLGREDGGLWAGPLVGFDQ